MPSFFLQDRFVRGHGAYRLFSTTHPAGPPVSGYIERISMKHARICPCSFRVAGGTLCACQQRRQAQRPTASQRGYGTDWQALRAAQAHTPCTACARPYRPGFHLDHMVARKAGGTDDPSNLHWLCHSCHSRKTVKQDGGFGHPVWLPKATLVRPDLGRQSLL